MHATVYPSAPNSDTPWTTGSASRLHRSDEPSNSDAVNRPTTRRLTTGSRRRDPGARSGFRRACYEHVVEVRFGTVFSSASMRARRAAPGSTTRLRGQPVPDRVFGIRLNEIEHGRTRIQLLSPSLRVRRASAEHITPGGRNESVLIHHRHHARRPAHRHRRCHALAGILVTAGPVMSDCNRWRSVVGGVVHRSHTASVTVYGSHAPQREAGPRSPRAARRPAVGPCRNRAPPRTPPGRSMRFPGCGSGASEALAEGSHSPSSMFTAPRRAVSSPSQGSVRESQCTTRDKIALESLHRQDAPGASSGYGTGKWTVSFRGEL